MGEPSLTPEAELTWRADLLRAAVKMLMLPVEGPTVKTQMEMVGR
jgi:hypothetical protein